MKTHKEVSLSKCCNYKVFFAPPACGDPGFYICEKCDKECEVERTEIEINKELSKGHFRPVDNSKIGY